MNVTIKQSIERIYPSQKIDSKKAFLNVIKIGLNNNKSATQKYNDPLELTRIIGIFNIQKNECRAQAAFTD